MKRSISDSVIVVTGASSGIGRATAIALAKERGTVVVASRQETPLNDVATECERAGGRSLAVPTDVTVEEEVRTLARRAVDTFGRIDAWVNDAAVTLLGRFEELPSDAFRRVLETNFFGYVHGARAALPYFREQGQGVLVNVASVLGKVGAPYVSAYVASKFAITGFSESLRMELLDTPGIQVVTVLPATIDTPLFQHAANFSGRAVQAMPPIYEPEQVADAIVGAIQHPKREVVVGNTRRMVAMHNLAPLIAERMVARKVEHEHFQNQPASPSRGNLFEPIGTFNEVHGGWSNGSHRLRVRRAGLKPAATALLAGLGAAAVYAVGRNPRLLVKAAKWLPRLQALKSLPRLMR